MTREPMNAFEKWLIILLIILVCLNGVVSTLELIIILQGLI